MVEFCVQRRGGLLLPLSASDRQAMDILPERRLISISASTKAPAKLKRWYWAMVQLLVEATGRWPSKEVAHQELMTLAGMIDSYVIDTNGTTRFTPMSVAGWELVEWRAYLDALVPIVIEKFVGETRAQFRNRVDAFLGIKYQEAWEG